MKKGSWISTRSGVEFSIQFPVSKAVRLEDIANGLAQCNRFVGQAPHPYSVAQHAVYLAWLFRDDRELSRWALMHDAAEAYIGDISRPLKELLPEIHPIENRILRVIAKHFGLHACSDDYCPYPVKVKEMDTRLLAAEAIQLKGGKPLKRWKALRNVEPAGVVIGEWDWKQAKRGFLNWAKELGLVEHE